MNSENTINLTAAELIELLHLNEAIFQGVEISNSIAVKLNAYCFTDEYRNDHLIHLEIIQKDKELTVYKLWTKKNWRAHSHNIQAGKEQEIKERRLWNLISESKADLVKAIVEKIGLKQKDAEDFALKIIEKKKWKNVAIFLDEEKYKDLL